MNKLMKASVIAVQLIKQLEGLKLHPYHDGAGYKTVGYGHLIENGEPTGEITKAEADEFLERDVSEAEDIVNRLVKVELTQNQFDVLVSFVFNIGEDQFRNSGLLRELNLEHYGEVPKRLALWNKIRFNGNLVVSKGLTNRRAMEIKLWNGVLEL